MHLYPHLSFFFFFFQAEDGIRDSSVTGVQTCALPILVLSCVGIYGVISFVVGQRTHEIGVRMALGAQSSDVMRLVFGEGGRMVLIGVAAGVGAALGLTRLIGNLLFGVAPQDPLTFAAVAVVL